VPLITFYGVLCIYFRTVKRIFFVVRMAALLSILSHVHFSAISQSSPHTDQQWLHYAAQWSVRPSFEASIEGSARFTGPFQSPVNSIARVMFSKAITTHWSAGMGLAHGLQYEAWRVDGYEWRPHQELVYRRQASRMLWMSRLRIEERWQWQDGQYAAFHVRARLLMSTEIPLRPSDSPLPVSFRLASEALVRNDWKRTDWLDQIRLVTGPVLHLPRQCDLSLLYQMQVHGDPLAGSYTYIHVAWIHLKQRF
jgi:hypothetical protein